jgi:hypothetical protein
MNGTTKTHVPDMKMTTLENSIPSSLLSTAASNRVLSDPSFLLVLHVSECYSRFYKSWFEVRRGSLSEGRGSLSEVENTKVER